MCGIVGAIGTSQTKNILLEGLAKLEYRGYDSAGVYLNDEAGHDFLIKEVGKIKNLKEKIPADVNGLAGIGHTRWATHGKATVDNAHPHFSENDRFFLVHNGVIENYQELKAEYLQEVKFTSDTDTEVVVQLVNYFAEAKHLSGFEALKQVLPLIKGSYAFVMMDSEQPDELYFAKSKSPLLLGIGADFNVIASDAKAMIDYTNQFIEIHDGEVGILTKDAYYLEKDGQQIKRETYEVEADKEQVTKAGYEHFMLKEINDQPQVLKNIIAEYFTDDHQIKIDEKLLNDLKDADRIYILAAGTSYHAGLVGKELFEKLANIPTEVDIASEFGHHFPILSKKPFFIFLSQSGETADSRQVLVEINKMGLPSLTITNSEKSTLAREASHYLNIYAGPEIAVASTKAYTSQIAVEAILAKAVGEVNDVQYAKDFDLQEELEVVASKIYQVLGDEEVFDQMTKDYLKDTRNAFYIGRGLDYDVALEAALKLKEVSYIQTEGFAAAELKHGTIALIEEGTPVIALINDPVTDTLTRGNIEEVKTRGAHTYVIATADVAKPGDDYILPEVNYLLSPMLTVIPTQLIGYYASLNRGYDVDQPRNLAKSVTVE